MVVWSAIVDWLLKVGRAQSRPPNPWWRKTRHHIAVGIAAALRTLKSSDGPTPAEIEAGEAADDACALADQAVSDYHRRQH
jgi:hypothetical protein